MILKTQQHESTSEAMLELLTILPKKKIKWFHDLIFALKEGEHEDLAEEIIPTLKKYDEGNYCCYKTILYILCIKIFKPH